VFLHFCCKAICYSWSGDAPEPEILSCTDRAYVNTLTTILSGLCYDQENRSFNAMGYYKHCLILLTSVLSFRAEAQQTFVEGMIRYAVSIGPVSDSTGFTEHAGTYTVIVKGSQLRKELKMNTGYQNIIITNANTNTAYSLQSAGGQAYAIQLSMQDLKERQRLFEGFRLQEYPGKMTIAGLPCEKATVTYKDGSKSSLYYTTTWQAPDMTLYDRFPGIKNIPLAFEYRNDDGIIMHFQAEKLEAVPVESALFRVPPEYKVISNAEYKQQRH
jgi:hypothetical protein